MTVRKLDADGDITTSGVQFIDGQSEVAQTVKTRLKLFLGEYFRDTSEGVPWFQKILGQKNVTGVADAIIRQKTLQTIGVSSLFEFTTDFDIQSRKYSVTIGVVTPYGNELITISDVV